MTAAAAAALAESLTRILSSPRLAEVTGIYISYVGDYAYLAFGMQHPEEDTATKVGTCAGITAA
jgi:secreted PhoX family phosphatase